MLKIFPMALPVLKMAPAAKPENKDSYSAPQICQLARSFAITDLVILVKACDV